MEGILNNFGKELNKQFYVYKNVETFNPTTMSHGDSGSSIVLGPIDCMKYTKAMAEKYFGEYNWKAEVECVTISSVSDVSDKNGILLINNENVISIDDVKYSISSIDDVAEQGEILLLGLSRVV